MVLTENESLKGGICLLLTMNQNLSEEDEEIIMARINSKSFEVQVLCGLIVRLENEIRTDQKYLRDRCDHDWVRDFEAYSGPCDRSHYYCDRCGATR